MKYSVYEYFVVTSVTTKYSLYDSFNYTSNDSEYNSNKKTYST